jgi:3-oxo-5-alpha-steroid 4-dehydrogenase 1
MIPHAHFAALLWGWLAVGAVAFFVLLRIAAPYGRHARAGWGPTVPGWVGWLIMESPSPVVMALLFATGNRTANLPALVFFALWELHYVNRAFVFPLRMAAGGKRMPVVITLLAIGFNLVNALFNGAWLFSLGPVLGSGWLVDPRFLGGIALFLAGFWINLRSDAVLRALRGPGDAGYQIPRGFLFEWVSCPNYVGEIVEWCGFAAATWSPSALVFALWTAANLLPRAMANHRWYQARFPDYPAARRAVIPFVL